MRILLLEDEYMLARSIRTYLLSRGHIVEYYDNGREVLDAIESRRHDFYILDINTPLIGGLECLKAIAARYPDVPKIIISAYHDIDNISEAFELGCSDYLKKPFNLKELDIRIQRLSTMMQHPAEKTTETLIQLSEHYTFDKKRNQLLYDGIVQQFTKREHSLLVLFVSNLGQVLNDENIRSFIWNGENTESSTIRSLVNRVRHKLKEDLIENMRGFGYLMKKASVG